MGYVFIQILCQFEGSKCVTEDYIMKRSSSNAGKVWCFIAASGVSCSSHEFNLYLHTMRHLCLLPFLFICLLGGGVVVKYGHVIMAGSTMLKS